MLGNPENERKCIFYLDTKPEVKTEAANQIRHENVELIRKDDKLERSLPQNENSLIFHSTPLSVKAPLRAIWNPNTQKVQPCSSTLALSEAGKGNRAIVLQFCTNYLRFH